MSEKDFKKIGKNKLFICRQGEMFQEMLLEELQLPQRLLLRLPSLPDLRPSFDLGG